MQKVGGPGGSKMPETQTQDSGSAPKADGQHADQFRKAVDRREEKGGGKGGEDGGDAKKGDAKGESKPADAKGGGKPADAKDGSKPADAKDGSKPADAKGGGKPADGMSKGPSRGDSMLKSLQSQSGESKEMPPGMQMPQSPAVTGQAGGGGEAQAPQVSNPAGRMESIGDIAKSVADSIQVGAKGTAGEGEVRIQLKDSVLGGAEVRIKQEGGRFEITFVTKTADAQNFLTTRMGEFKGELGNRLEREVNITVETQEDMDHQDQQDRRSRQQYVAEDDQGQG